MLAQLVVQFTRQRTPFAFLHRHQLAREFAVARKQAHPLGFGVGSAAQFGQRRALAAQRAPGQTQPEHQGDDRQSASRVRSSRCRASLGALKLLKALKATQGRCQSSPASEGIDPSASSRCQRANPSRSTVRRSAANVSRMDRP